MGINVKKQVRTDYTRQAASLNMSPKEWTKVLVLNDPVEAEILRGLLEAQGIQVLLSKEAVGQVYGLTVGSASEVEFFVPKDQAEHAWEILRQYVKDLGTPDQG